MNNLSKLSENEIIDGVLAEFAELAKIPRPSGNEKAVSDYLYQLFTDMGCTVEQDAVNNIIADMPATSDAADKPLTIMQAHMDMVCVANPGVAYDPLHDAIKLVREGDLLHADGTSLGADDGMGIAIIVFIMKHLESHGPLRAIITVDEEKGMTGAETLAAQAFEGAKYLINCDSEDWDLLTVGSAGSGDIFFRKNYTPAAPAEGAKAYTLSLHGFKGGHSGEEINCGAANAIKAAADVLYAIMQQGIQLNIASFTGGQAKNVIANTTEVVFYSSEEQEILEEIIDDAYDKLMTIYGDVESKALIQLAPASEAPSAMGEDVSAQLVRLLMALPHGVSAMSQLCPGLVQSSANVGVIKTEDNSIEIWYMPRSAIEASIEEYYASTAALGELAGFEVSFGKISPSWAERKNSKLAEIMLAVFEEQNQQPMRMATIHAGLECSWHLQKNPELDIVSIGTNNNDIHSPKETLELKTVPPQVLLIAETLQRI